MSAVVAAAVTVAATCATIALPPPAAVDAAPAQPAGAPPARPTGADPWLDTINWWRSFGGAADGSGRFRPVTSSPLDDVGPQAHANYLASIWRLGSDWCGHGADPAHPRPAGDYAHQVLFCGPPTVSEAVDGWMNTPYHAMPLLAPGSVRIGHGTASDGTRTVSTAGVTASAPIDRVHTWPAPGGTLPRTAMRIAESPDPERICAPTGGDPGQPVFAFFPTPRALVSLDVADGAGAVPACVLGDSTATRAAGAGDVLSTYTVFARRPFAVGSTVSVSLTTTDVGGGDPQTLTWGFRAVDVPSPVEATLVGQAGAAKVDVAPSAGLADGASPILDRRIVLFARSIGIVGEPIWRVPVPGPGSHVVSVPAGDYWACVQARNAVGWSACSGYVRLVVSEPATAPGAGDAGFLPVDPVRLADTREPSSPIARLRAGRVTVLDIRHRLPSGAVAVALNLASVGASAPGWVRVYPCAASAPATSNLNPEVGIVTTSATVVKVGDGRLCFQTLADTDIVVDLNGWLTTQSDAGLVTASARRVLDTRPGSTPGAASRRLAPGSVLELPVVPAGSATVAVALNVTAVDPGANGFVTVWPCGTARPFVANLTPSAGVTRPNLVNVRVGANGAVCVYSTGATDLVVDVIGEYQRGARARFAGIEPARLLDTRTSSGAVGPDGATMLPAGNVVALQGTLTAAAAPTAGYMASYACTAQAWPGIANVTFREGETAGNAALMPAAGGTSCVRNPSGTAFVVDVTGVWRTP